MVKTHTPLLRADGAVYLYTSIILIQDASVFVAMHAAIWVGISKGVCNFWFLYFMHLFLDWSQHKYFKTHLLGGTLFDRAHV